MPRQIQYGPSAILTKAPVDQGACRQFPVSSCSGPPIKVTSRRIRNPPWPAKKMPDGPPQTNERGRLALLIGFHIVICCVSLIYVADNDHPVIDPTPFHMFFDPARLHIAVAVIALFALLSLLFVFARFSFGYFAGFYLYTMILGYLWLNCFSPFAYHHRLAGVSAAISAVAFLLPALSTGSPITQVYVLSERTLERLLVVIMSVAV